MSSPCPSTCLGSSGSWQWFTSDTAVRVHEHRTTQTRCPALCVQTSLRVSDGQNAMQRNDTRQDDQTCSHCTALAMHSLLHSHDMCTSPRRSLPLARCTMQPQHPAPFEAAGVLRERVFHQLRLAGTRAPCLPRYPTNCECMT
jgi:hypothetical protein